MAGSSVVPGIAIRIGGGGSTATSTPHPGTPAPEVPEDLATNLYGIYMQATKGAVRQQWIILPPPLTSLGVKNLGRGAEPLFMYLNRTQQYAGNRSKWFHMKQWHTSDTLTSEFKKLLDDGWSVIDPVVVPIEVDDYLAVWNERKTPHKYIRAIDRVINPMGLSTK